MHYDGWIAGWVSFQNQPFLGAEVFVINNQTEEVSIITSFDEMGYFRGFGFNTENTYEVFALYNGPQGTLSTYLLSGFTPFVFPVLEDTSDISSFSTPSHSSEETALVEITTHSHSEQETELYPVEIP